MAKLVVLTDDQRTMYSESVSTLHFTDAHSSSQILQRLAWAVEDAEKAEKPKDVPAIFYGETRELELHT